MTMRNIVVASNNPVKLQAVRSAFERVFPGDDFVFQGASVPSGVSDQPMSSAETLQGALNRTNAIRVLYPQADFWVGIEGGVQPDLVGNLTRGELWAFAWVVVASQDTCGKGCTGAFELPPPIADLVRQGHELGAADDIVFGRSNSKQENGAVGLLTGDIIDRASYYVHALVLALIPFKNVDLYQDNQPLT